MNEVDLYASKESKGRGLALAFMVVVVAVTTITPALSATVLDFDPPSGSVGEKIVGTTRGAGMQGIASGRVVVLLAASQTIADSASGLDDPRLSRFGAMTADADQVGHFVGRVPDLPGGEYVAVAHCGGCAPGGSTFTVGSFTILGSPLPHTGGMRSQWPLAGLALIVAGVTIWGRAAKRTRAEELHSPRS